MSESQGSTNGPPIWARREIDSGKSDWKFLLTSVGPSLDFRKLFLALLGICLGWSGLLAIDRSFVGTERFAPAWEIGRSPLPGRFAGEIEIAGKPRLPGDPDTTWIGALEESAGLTIEPIVTITKPFRALFSMEPGWKPFVHALLGAIWLDLVWSLIGGAIARIALIESSYRDRISIAAGLRFALRHRFDLIVSPFFPFGVVTLVALFCGLLGLLYRIPGSIGATIAGVALFLPLLAGTLSALVLLGLFLSWPFMIVTVAAEGEDVFDAVSRGYAYAFRRIPLYAFYLAIAWAVGTVGSLFTTLFARTSVHLAHWGLSWGASVHRLENVFNPFSNAAAAGPAHAWLWLVGLIVHAWVYSYFWTAFSRMYLLLRMEIDGTRPDDLDRPSGDEESERS